MVEERYSFTMEISVFRFPISDSWRAVARVGDREFNSTAYSNATDAVFDLFREFNSNKDKAMIAFEMAMVKGAENPKLLKKGS